MFFTHPQCHCLHNLKHGHELPAPINQHLSLSFAVTSGLEIHVVPITMNDVF